MKKIFLTFFFLYSLLTWSQVTFDKDNDIRLGSLPYYSYGKGLGITSADSIFQLNIRFRMQNRVTYYDYEDKSAEIEGMIRRLRLRFDGYVGDPRFLYAIQLSFAPNDVGYIQPGENINIIRDAMIFYRPNKYWTYGLGQTKLPGNRQRVNSSGALQLTDRSINNAKFNIDRDFGFQINYTKLDSDKTSYAVRGSISSGEGRNWTKTKDTGLAYTGKLEFYPFGSFKKDGTNFEGAIIREEKPKLYLAAVYHKNNQAVRSSGQYGADLFQARNLQNLFGDLVFKYQNWALMVAYMNRTTTNGSYVTYSPTNPNDISFVFGGQGMDYQASYTFKENYELIARYSWQNVNKQIHSYEPNAKQYSIGVNKYIWEHAFKLQAEVSYNQREYLSPRDDNDWYVRFQVEIGI